jgi:hypothetical protein
MRRAVCGCLTALALAAAGAGAARAQVTAEAIPLELVRQYAPFLVLVIQQQFPEPPVKLEPNAEKIQAFHIQENAGVVLLPDRKLTLDVLNEDDEREVPLGICCTRLLTVEHADKAVTGPRLAVADLGEIKFPVLYLTASKRGDQRLLKVYSRDGTPIAEVPLTRSENTGPEMLGVKLTNIDLEKKKLDAVFTLGNGYQGTLKLTYLE